MNFHLLGALRVTTDAGAEVTVPGTKVRALLVALLSARRRRISAPDLVQELWQADEPQRPLRALQSKVSQLRKALSEAEPGAGELVVGDHGGYVLDAEPGTVDLDRFDRLMEDAYGQDDAAARARALQGVLALWDGSYEHRYRWAGNGYDALILRLESQRLQATEELLDAWLGAGAAERVVAEAPVLVSQYPERERITVALMGALHACGRQSEALELFRNQARRLRDELGLEPGAEMSRMHEAILRQEADVGVSRSPRGSALRLPARSNLPRHMTALVGRDAETPRVRAAMRTRRLVTLTGPGGVGKTRLAVEASRTTVRDHPDGVWLADLSHIDASDGSAVRRIVAHVAGILGLGEPQRGAPPLDWLAGALFDSRVLLILDNCEQVRDACAELARVLAEQTPEVRILATSREPLGVPGELVHPVLPLAMPDAVESDLLAWPAVRLLVDRAQDGDPTFDPHAASPEALLEICRRLNGIPLAIELVAPRLRTVAAEEMVRWLDDEMWLLDIELSHLPVRQRSMWAAVEWSWRMLTEREREVLARLATQAGSWEAAAGLACCRALDPAGDEVVNVISRLVTRSLVAVSVSGPQRRYAVLEPVRQFCREKLTARELADTRHSLARFYAQQVRRIDEQLRGAGQEDAFRRLDLDAANIRQSLEWAVTAGEPLLGLRIAVGMAWYWVQRGRLDEGSDWLRRALDLAVGGEGDGEPSLALEAATWEAAMRRLRGIPCDVDALRLDHWPESRSGLGLLRARGLLAVVLPAGESTVDLVEQTLATCRRLDYRWGEAAVLSTRALERLRRGAFDTARDDAERSVAGFLDLGDQWGVIHASDCLAALSTIAGDLDDAEQLHRRSMAVATHLGLWPKVSHLLCELGQLALRSNRTDEAESLFQEALHLAVRQNTPAQQQVCELGQATVERQRGEYLRASARLERWLRWNISVGWIEGEVRVRLERARLSLARGRTDEARADSAAARAAATELGDWPMVASACETLARAAILLDDRVTAEECWRQAKQTRRDMRVPATGEDAELLDDLDRYFVAHTA
ncbi:AfsR/SARP family transcriptional regulator [Myceligenerans salitolerans]|uniref:Tetratricopeptide repeat protein n=1 Tax=Myceligenerans salitolerans TaxID=1230528 RepID=A0ABS3IDY4_9MICO|nr:BTAD domain-containing putative transcriptional regulator [Myceligenerans salitolerans]MBO0611193.1 tetratricopeptide repeat protein [Myceligenerans salitolerans]